MEGVCVGQGSGERVQKHFPKRAVNVTAQKGLEDHQGKFLPNVFSVSKWQGQSLPWVPCLPDPTPGLSVFFTTPRIPPRTPGLYGYAQGRRKAGRPKGYGVAGRQTQLVTGTNRVSEQQHLKVRTKEGWVG